MNTVGSILKKRRLEKNLTLEEAESHTKIRKKYISDIESDNYSNLPSISYAKGFVKNYSSFLGLNSSHIMAFFRRQTQEAKKSSLLPKGVTEPLNESLFQLTPKRFIAILVIVLLGIFLIYFGLQYRKIKTSPYLIIEKPEAGQVIYASRTDVLGLTDSDATVTVNGVSVLVRSDGKFFDQVNLNPGNNEIIITAASRFGKTQTRKVTVIKAD